MVRALDLRAAEARGVALESARRLRTVERPGAVLASPVGVEQVRRRGEIARRVPDLGIEEVADAVDRDRVGRDWCALLALRADRRRLHPPRRGLAGFGVVAHRLAELALDQRLH